tara:strand:+ start:62 stop:529 length:468 start_codon:yes stop_codon:yes gene_type:complete
MSEAEYYNKIELLKAMQIDVWVRKKDSSVEKNKEIFKNILILESLKSKHEQVVNNFIVAAKKECPSIEYSYLSQSDLLNLVNENDVKDETNIFLVLCDDKIQEILSKKIDIVENFYIDDVKKNTYFFNKLLEEKTITNKMKKEIWNNFLNLVNYE